MECTRQTSIQIAPWKMATMVCRAENTSLKTGADSGGSVLGLGGRRGLRVTCSFSSTKQFSNIRQLQSGIIFVANGMPQESLQGFRTERNERNRYIIPLHGFLVAWFFGFLVSKIEQFPIACFLEDIDLIFQIFVILLDGSSSFPGARLFQNCQSIGFPQFRDL